MTAAMTPQLKTGVVTSDCNSWDLSPYAGSLTPTLSERTRESIVVSLIFKKVFHSQQEPKYHKSYAQVSCLNVYVKRFATILDNSFLKNDILRTYALKSI